MSIHVGFNYSELKNAKIRTEAKKQAEHINRLLTTSTEAIVDIGKRLNVIRASMNSTEFRGWIKVEFRWTQPVSANYMQTARVFGELDCLSKFQPTALMSLARNNIPKNVIDAMIARARAGEVITHMEVKKALLAEPGFTPSRKDAGKARKPSSERSIANSPSLQPEAPGPMTMASVQKSLDSLLAILTQIDMEQSEREALSNRFFEMGAQLRMQQPRTSTKPTAATKPKTVKPRTAKTAA